VGKNLFRGILIPEPEGGTLRITVRVDFGGIRVERATRLCLGVLEAGREVWFTTRNYRVKLAAPQAYSSRSLIAVTEEQGTVHDGFVSSAGRLVLEPAGVFFNERVEVLVVRKEADLKAGYGVFAEYGEYTSFRGSFDSLGWCGFGLRQPEHLVVLEDRDGPRIEPIRDFRRRPLDGKATFVSGISDRGSGVVTGSLRAFVDDEVAIVSVDPDTGRIDGRTTKPLPYGEHRFRLEAEDRLGNASSREFTLDLSR
jgi:hypothetical protein